MDTLDRIKDIIIEEVCPDKIILFGSRARGDHSENSDYDILILKRNMINSRKSMGTIYKRLFRERIIDDIDLLMADPDIFEEHKNTVGYVYHNIHKDGRTIFGS